MAFDLLSTVESGGCSAKLPASGLEELLKFLPRSAHENLLVGIETHDDAGVYKLSETVAIIQTVDFFPPLCSDPFDFGQIAAANALSDVYAMGGQALTAMNIALFPSGRIPMDVLADILRGGHDKVTEASALMVGGHTIDDYPPKYGLSVTGIVHPSKVITNTGARPGDVLILTISIGTGIIMAGKRTHLVGESAYQSALDSMKQLNRVGSLLMQEHGVRSATDITGFGLLGHAAKLAAGSDVSLCIYSTSLPLLPEAYRCADQGCLPSACFRNLEFIEQKCTFGPKVDYTIKMLMCDAQTSGGLFMAAPPEMAVTLLEQLRAARYSTASIIGEVVDKNDTALNIT